MSAPALDKAIEHAGSQALLAAKISSPGKLVKQQHISYWKKSEKVPAEYVLSIERETGVSRHELRPDLYPKEHQYSPHDSSLTTECEAVPMRKAG